MVLQSGFLCDWLQKYGIQIQFILLGGEAEKCNKQGIGLVCRKTRFIFFLSLNFSVVFSSLQSFLVSLSSPHSFVAQSEALKQEQSFPACV